MKLHKIFSASLCLCLLCLCALCAGAGDYGMAVVRNDKEPYNVNLRKGKGTSTQLLGTYYSGTLATLYDTSDEEWWQVEIYGRRGYMLSRFLVECGLQSEPDEDVIAGVRDARKTYVVDNPNPMDRLNLRERPDASWASAGKYYNGTEVLVLGTVGEWCHVLVEDQTRSGFMQQKYLSPEGTEVAPPVMRPEGEAGGAEEALGYAIVNNPQVTQKLYLRDSPSQSGKSLRQYENGTTVELLSHQEGWYEVRAYNRGKAETGWMSDEYLIADAQCPLLTPLTEGIVDGPAGRDLLPIYQQPTQAGDVRYAPFTKGETRVQILGRAGTFYRVRAGEEEGFTLTQWVRLVGDGSGDYGVVCNPEAKDRLNVRVSPEAGTKIAAKLFNGTQVEILEERDGDSEDGGWLRVRANVCGAQKEGWVMGRFITRVE